MSLILLARCVSSFSRQTIMPSTGLTSTSQLRFSSKAEAGEGKGKLLVLGGTGYLGQHICQRAVLEGYSVVSLSRRGLPPASGTSSSTSNNSAVDYRQGDARQPESVRNILNEGGFSGVVHCIGLLFDDASGLGNLNKYVSGSGSLPDKDATYDAITRLTAFNAIDTTTEYAENERKQSFPFCFVSAAEAGWPEVTGGKFMDRMAPDFLQRYLQAKRAVEAKLLDTPPTLRPIIMRPSLIYSYDRPASLPAVGTFAILNKIGLPFVDRPVQVDALASAIVNSIGRPDVQGVQRYFRIDELSSGAK
jgi:uncharacterized protein YbjT (DUF2867 family)